MTAQPDCYRCAEVEAFATVDPLEAAMLLGGRMFVCPTCGNKRCPRATDCDFACTGSNEPGQQGSRY